MTKFVFNLIFVCGMIAHEAHAQDSLFSVLDYSRFTPASNTINTYTPVLPLLQASRISSINLTLANESGSFRRPQEPSSIQSLTFHAEGTQQTDKVITSAGFTYLVQQDEGQQWRNTGHAADYQPFVWADQAVGTWNRSHFDARITIADNTLKRMLQPGLTLTYHGGTGDRQNTPKPLYRFHQLSAQPFILFRNKQDAFVFRLKYEQHTEDNEMGYYVNDSPLLYRLRGYGTFSRSPFVSGNRLLEASTLGGSIEYMRGNLSKKFRSANLSYNQTTGSVTEGTSVTTPGGAWKTQIISSVLSSGIERLQCQWMPMLHFHGAFQTGTDPIFGAVNYYLNILAVRPSLRYIYRQRWFIEIDTEYAHRSQRDIVTGTNAEISRAGGNLKLYSRKALSQKTSLYAQSCVGYYQPLSSTLQITTSTEMSEALVRPDFDVMAKAWLQSGIETGLDVKSVKNTIRFSLQLMHHQQASINRKQFNLSIHYFIL
jgi:hypothetical protein